MIQAGQVLGKEGLTALWLKQHGAGETMMAADLKGYFADLEQRVFAAVNAEVMRRIDEAAQTEAEEDDLTEEEAGDLAEELAEDLIDVEQVYQEILDVVRPTIYNQVATGAATEWKLNLPEKQLDLSWIKNPSTTWKEVCRTPAGEPGGGQFAPCGEGGGGGDSAATAAPVPASAVRGDFSNLPGRDNLVGTASSTAVPLASLSISKEADRAIDDLFEKRFGDIKQRYGDELGTAIIAAGYLGGIAGAAATVAGGVAMAGVAATVHAYVSAASALGFGLMSAAPAGAFTARMAVAPLIGAARYIKKNFSPQLDAKAASEGHEPDEIASVAQREWHDILDDWHLITRNADWAKAPTKADDVGSLSSGLRIDLPPAMRAAAEAFAEGILARPYWRDIAETIRQDIADDIRQGVLEGLSGKQIAANLKDTVNSDSRADNIARTETTGALNAGHQATREELVAEGLISGKEWLAILDQSVRETHEEANEQKRPVDEPFEVGGELGMYPGDPDFSASERCRCRCTSVSTFDDSPESAEEEEKRLIAWMKGMRKWWGLAANHYPAMIQKATGVIDELREIRETIRKFAEVQRQGQPMHVSLTVAPVDETFTRDAQGRIISKSVRPLQVVNEKDKVDAAILVEIRELVGAVKKLAENSVKEGVR